PQQQPENGKRPGGIPQMFPVHRNLHMNRQRRKKLQIDDKPFNHFHVSALPSIQARAVQSPPRPPCFRSSTAPPRPPPHTLHQRCGPFFGESCPTVSGTQTAIRHPNKVQTTLHC